MLAGIMARTSQEKAAERQYPEKNVVAVVSMKDR
jgi:hypothetical protein